MTSRPATQTPEQAALLMLLDRVDKLERAVAELRDIRQRQVHVLHLQVKSLQAELRLLRGAMVMQ